MSSKRVQALAYVQPKGHRPIKQPAHLDYATKNELRHQLRTFASTQWFRARRIDVDLDSCEIIVDGRPVANYAIHFPSEPADQTAALL